MPPHHYLSKFSNISETYLGKKYVSKVAFEIRLGTKGKEISLNATRLNPMN